MQGIKTWIPTERKIAYVEALLKVGFDTLDMGSFVSPKAIPQMADTRQVLDAVDKSKGKSKFLAIVANRRGAEAACNHHKIDCVGYPFSISENFQMRNTHKTIADSIIFLEELSAMVSEYKKELIVYLSMGFGNPYGDPWSCALVGEWVERLAGLGVKTINLSDTVGTAELMDITNLFSTLIPQFPAIEFGAHLHTQSEQATLKIEAAYTAGCRRFDGTIKGFGGCPMAKDELVGNMPTEKLISFLSQKKIAHTYDVLAFESAYNEALKTFI